MPVEAKLIWVVADDYGIARGVNAAIRDLLAQGAINATSVMVVASGFDEREAAALTALRAASSIAVGLHLTLTAPFQPLTADYAPTRAGSFLPLDETFVAAALGRMRVDALQAEAAAQIARFTDVFGWPPDYIDGHQHVHLFPRMADGVLAAARTGAPGAWIRQCGRTVRSGPGAKALVLDLLSARFRKRAAAAGLRTNPGFAGSYDFGTRTDFADLFATFLQGLPDGGVVMCHPGLVDAELARNDTLTGPREREYAFFQSSAYRELLVANNYVLAQRARRG
jgi:chitin disaccharide deacetylase